MKDIRTIEFNTRMHVLPKGENDISYLENILIPRNRTSVENVRRTINANEIISLFQSKVGEKHDFTSEVYWLSAPYSMWVF